MPHAKTLPTRHEALDSWRGICACLVAIFHFDPFSNFYDFLIIRHGVLFVDFFFVLSGFVIAASYLERLQTGFGLTRFMFLRAGRVWPLHVFMLAVFIVFEAAFGGLLQAYSPTGRQPFEGPNSVTAIFTNLALIHSLNVHDFGTWNVPSWSISVEYYTYLLFALLVLATGRWIGVAAGILMVLFPVLFLNLDGLTMGAGYDYGIVRCAYGFCAGAVANVLYRRSWGPIAWLKTMGVLTGTVMETLAIGLSMALIAYGKFTIYWDFTPYIFGFAILVFAPERGLISRVLTTAPFLLLGTLSYSIYMVHYFIQLRIMNFAQLVEKLSGWTLFTPGIGEGGRMQDFLGLARWQGDIAYVLMLLAVIGASYVTYRLIEKPGQDLSRDWARRIWGARPRTRPQTAEALESGHLKNSRPC